MHSRKGNQTTQIRIVKFKLWTICIAQNPAESKGPSQYHKKETKKGNEQLTTPKAPKHK